MWGLLELPRRMAGLGALGRSGAGALTGSSLPRQVGGKAARRQRPACLKPVAVTRGSRWGANQGVLRLATAPVTPSSRPHQPREDGGGPWDCPPRQPSALPRAAQPGGGEVLKGHESAILTKRWPGPPRSSAALQLGGQILRIPSGSLLSADPARTVNLGFRGTMTPPRERSQLCAVGSLPNRTELELRGEGLRGKSMRPVVCGRLAHPPRSGSTCLPPRSARLGSS